MLGSEDSWIEETYDSVLMSIVSTVHQLQIRHQACVKQKCIQIHIYYLFHFNIKFWPVEENVKLAVKSNNCTNNVKLLRENVNGVCP